MPTCPMRLPFMSRTLISALPSSTLSPGTGGRFSPGLGKAVAFKETSPNHNLLVDPKALTPIMGQPCYVDMVVKVRKA